MTVFQAGETVTRLRATALVSVYSGAASSEDWTTPDSLDITGCAVALGSTFEPVLDARDLVASDFTVYAPTGSDIRADDRLVIRGLTCTVVGRPFDWSSPFTGWAAGMAVQANVVEG